MQSEKIGLKRRYLKAIRRAERERDVIHRARDRKIYWENVAEDLEKRLNLAKEGQMEFNVNQGEVL